MIEIVATERCIGCDKCIDVCPTRVFDRGADDVTAICLLGTPEGVAAIEKLVGDRNVTLVLGALDERLNEKGYILPGLGDAGDRIFGTRVLHD